jgi:hypothetical protein
LSLPGLKQNRRRKSIFAGRFFRKYKFRVVFFNKK